MPDPTRPTNRLDDLLLVLTAALTPVLGALLVLSGTALTDCMGYYHIAMARLYTEHGFVREFPWMPFTDLANAFADQHFLYNLSLMPWVWLLPQDPVLALHLTTIFWFALISAAVAWILRDLKIPQPWLFHLIFFFSIVPFSHRLLMPRPLGASVFFFVLFLWAMGRRSRTGLIVVSFLYGWLYHAAFQILACAGLYVLLVRLFEREWRWNLFLWPFVGFSLSLIVNPFVPTSITFFVAHTFFLSHAKVGVAPPAEWNSPGFGATLEPMILVLGLLLLLSLPHVLARRRPGVDAILMAALTGIYFLGTLKAVRFIEYLGIFPPLLAAMLWRDLPPVHPMLKKTVVLLIVVLVGIGAGLFIPKQIELHQTALFPESRMAGVGHFLRTHEKPLGVVFNAFSGDFPELFYQAPNLAYVEGSNHALLAYHDPNLYKEFMKVVLHPDSNSGRVVRERFHARYVVLTRLSSGFLEELLKAIESGQGFREVYRDEYGLVAEALP